MTGEPHEISLILGRLQESVENLRGDVGELRRESQQHMAESTMFRQQMAGTVSDVKEMKPHVEDYKKKKHWLAGFAAGVAAISGGLSSAVLKWLQ